MSSSSSSKGKGEDRSSSRNASRNPSKNLTSNSPQGQKEPETERYPNQGEQSIMPGGHPSLHTSGASVVSQQLQQYYLYLAVTQGSQSGQGDQSGQGNSDQGR
ncbi:hypothetical protein K469DRAFT_704005 [Zopfia rhizophila CBS 207.26]|uniref:Uncharacterized protein n=1 Tax=Zopfia rhizophila CBS 207.26 TaxID=1314779 RepID=A0A6A6D656_9PEZI|nr:hypothetical protein K469DRAFT_704005 [Zopfia rhizophila CBS 207.26]